MEKKRRKRKKRKRRRKRSIESVYGPSLIVLLVYRILAMVDRHYCLGSAWVFSRCALV